MEGEIDGRRAVLHPNVDELICLLVKQDEILCLLSLELKIYREERVYSKEAKKRNECRTVGTNTLSGEYIRCRAEWDGMLQTIEFLEKELKLIRSISDSKQIEVENLNDKYHKELAQLSDRLSQLETCLAQKNLEIDNLREEKNILEAKISAFSKSYFEKTSLDEDYSKRFCKEAALRKKEIAYFTERISILIDDNSKLRSSILAYETELAANKESPSLDALLVEQQKLIDQLRNECESLFTLFRNSRHKYRKEVKYLKRQNNDLESQLERFIQQ